MARYVVEMTTDLALLLKNAGQVKIIETLQEDGLLAELETGPAPIKPSSSVPTTPSNSGPRVSEDAGPDDTPHQTPPTPGSRSPRITRSAGRFK